MVLKGWVNSLHRTAGNVAPLAWLALKVRNQCECIIGYRLGEDAEVTDTGNSEDWLVSLVAREVNWFLDVGANVGDWTACILSENADVRGVLCEPVPWCYESLLCRFAGNLNLCLLPVALSSSGGKARFSIMPGNAKTSSLLVPRNNPIQSSIEVDLKTVDMIAEESGCDFIDFLKCDCEGFDLPVLQGGRKMITEGRVGLIQFEYNSMWIRAGYTLAQALEWLASNGYQGYLLRHRALWHFDYEKWGEFERFANFVAFRRGSKFESQLVAQIKGKI
ncbi:MAG TPA: FkbM family methyltransferase [Blastocatellia bacterium]|nr:FkbM family methyltransferase [Blastocatellia bacterium]